MNKIGDKIIDLQNGKREPVCDRSYNDGGAHSVQMKDGVPCCPSCGQPIRNHPTNAIGKQI